MKAFLHILIFSKSTYQKYQVKCWGVYAKKYQVFSISGKKANCLFSLQKWAAKQDFFYSFRCSVAKLFYFLHPSKIDCYC